MNNTLIYLLDNIQNNQEQSIDLIYKIDSFYNNAWNKLVIIITIVFTIVGVIIPIFIQWLQKKSLKTSEELLKREIKDKTDSVREELKRELIIEIEAKFENYKNEIKITRASANAKLYLAEGKVKLSMNYYDKALNDFVTASLNCIESNNYPTLSDALKIISEDCLPYLSIEEIDDLKTRYNCDFDLFIADLTKHDDRLYFREIIGEMRVKMSKLPRTIREKPEEQSKKAQQ